MRRKQTSDEIAAKKQLISETALSLLTKEEYKKITIRQITAACGMATGTFFNYYPSKETLFLELLYNMNTEYYLREIQRLQETDPRSFDDYARFLMDGAKNVIENRQDLITLFILHHEILSSATPEHVPEEANENYLKALNDLASAIHAALPFISPGEALRNYSFFHAHLIGSRHIAPISVLGSYSPAYFDANTEVLQAYERYLEGTRRALGF